jgi:hypothetical protein
VELTTIVVALVKPVVLQVPEVNAVTLNVTLPTLVNPVAVKVPVPGVVTVMAAVNPVAEGELLLYVTVYVPFGNPVALELNVTVDVTGDAVGLQVLVAVIPVRE